MNKDNLKQLEEQLKNAKAEKECFSTRAQDLIENLEKIKKHPTYRKEILLNNLNRTKEAYVESVKNCEIEIEEIQNKIHEINNHEEV